MITHNKDSHRVNFARKLNMSFRVILLNLIPPGCIVSAPMKIFFDREVDLDGGGLELDVVNVCYYPSKFFCSTALTGTGWARSTY